MIQAQVLSTVRATVYSRYIDVSGWISIAAVKGGCSTLTMTMAFVVATQNMNLETFRWALDRFYCLVQRLDCETLILGTLVKGSKSDSSVLVYVSRPLSPRASSPSLGFRV
jgi:hypothetical protein